MLHIPFLSIDSCKSYKLRLQGENQYERSDLLLWIYTYCRPTDINSSLKLLVASSRSSGEIFSTHREA